MGGPIYFVPLGDFPANEPRQMETLYERRHGLKVRLLSRLPLPSSALDQERGRNTVRFLELTQPEALREFERAGVNLRRGQYGAEGLIAWLEAGHPSQARQADAVMIGFTNRDMYREVQPNVSFYFASRSPETRSAVISTARMRLLGGVENRRLYESRLHKMTTKQIGVLYYGLR